MSENGHFSGENHSNEDVVYLARIAGEEGVIKDRVFRDCRVVGPAVLLIDGEFEIYSNQFENTPEEFLWELSDERTRVAGAILVQNSSFEGCTFTNVGFAGHTPFIRQMRESLVPESAAT